jgi:transcriptional regulator with XRE-family HTH domain
VATVAVNVRGHRLHQGLSQGRLAVSSGIDIGMLKHIEKCRADPAIPVLLRLAGALGLMLEDLVERTTPPAGGPGPNRYARPDEVVSAIGPRVRAGRLARNLTRRRFAEISGISEGMVHYIETSAIVPKTKMLARLAATFDISFSAFVESLVSPVLAIARRANTAPDHDTLLLVDQLAPAGAIRFSESRLLRGQSVAEKGKNSASTVMLYVIEGEVRLTFDSTAHELHPGDAALFWADRAHTIAAAGSGVARFLRVTRSESRTTP